MGFILEAHYRPELLYCREGQTGKPWDEDALVAALAWEKEPDVAETALARMLQAGYPRDFFVQVIGAHALLGQHRFEDAREMAWAAYQARPEYPPAFVVYATAALSSQDFVRLNSVYEKSGYHMLIPPVTIQAIADAWTAIPAEVRAKPPSMLMKGKDYLNLVPILEEAEKGDRVSRNYAGRLRSTNGVNKLQAPGRDDGASTVAWAMLGPSVKNGAIQIRFTSRILTKTKSSIPNLVSIGFQNAETPNSQFLGRFIREVTSFELRMLIDRTIEIFMGFENGMHLLPAPAINYDGKTVHEARLIVNEHLVEVLFNDRRIYLGPRNPQGPPELFTTLRCLNMEAALKATEILDLDKKPADAPVIPPRPPETPPAPPKEPNAPDF